MKNSLCPVCISNTINEKKDHCSECNENLHDALKYVENNIKLNCNELNDEFYYQSITYMAIDTIYSLQANYDTITKKVVD